VLVNAGHALGILVHAHAVRADGVLLKHHLHVSRVLRLGQTPVAVVQNHAANLASTLVLEDEVNDLVLLEVVLADGTTSLEVTASNDTDLLFGMLEADHEYYLPGLRILSHGVLTLLKLNSTQLKPP
jgi:hypothetical protein